MRSCLARTMPSSTGSTASRCDGLATTLTVVACSPSRVVNLPVMPRWYLTSPRALGRLRVEVPLELGEDLLVRLADDVGEHVEPAAVGHADDDLVEAALGRRLQDLVEQRDDALAALEREPLLTDVLGLQEGLERLGRVEPDQDVALLLRRGLGVAPLDPLLDPAPLLGILDVHVLDADAAAVRVAQHAEDVAQLHPLLAGEARRPGTSGRGPTGSARARGRRGPGAGGCGTRAGRCRP